MKMIRNLLAAAALVAAVSLTGCGSVTPPGKTVIILTPDGESKVITDGVYRAWGRDKLYFVDGKLKSYEEQMKILCTDDINMDVDVKTIMCFNVTKESIEFIKSKVPSSRVDEGDVTGYQLSLDKFYDMAVTDIVRSSARNIVSTYITDDIRPNRVAIEAAISAEVMRRLGELNYPLTISAVLVSNIDYPDSVKTMRNDIKRAQLEDQKSAALAEAMLAQMQREAGIEVERAKVRMIKAQAQADENQILTGSLTPEFLMWRQYEVMEMTAAALAEGTSNTVFMMPYSAINPDTLNTAMIRDSIGQTTNANN